VLSQKKFPKFPKIKRKIFYGLAWFGQKLIVASLLARHMSNNDK